MGKMPEAQNFLIPPRSYLVSKFVVNFNLIILSKPKCIVILTGLFCSVVARGTSHFYSCFFRKWFWQELIFGMTTMTFGLGKPSQTKNRTIEEEKSEQTQRSLNKHREV